MKHCSKCFEVLPENKNNFVARKESPLGISSQCKGCRRDYLDTRKERDRYLNKKWRDENKDRLKKYDEEYRRNNKEHYRDYNYSYYRKNKEKINKRYAEYYQENKEIYKKNQAAYAKEKPEIFRRYRQERKHRLEMLMYDFTPEQWQHCLMHFNHSCAYCGHTDALEQEHVIPVSKGGHYTADNIIPACRSCNASKNNKDFKEWYAGHKHYNSDREQYITDYLKGAKANERNNNDNGRGARSVTS